MKKKCPKCGSDYITYQREQTGNIGAGTNRVVIQQAKKSHGCLIGYALAGGGNLYIG